MVLQNLGFGTSSAKPNGEEGERESERERGKLIVDMWERRLIVLEDVTICYDDCVCVQGGLEHMWKHEQRDSNAAVR